MSKFKIYTSNWLVGSTITGLSNIKRARFKLIKIIWVLCMIASLAGCSRMIIDLVLRYFKYSVNVSLKIKSASSQNFPAVTFCNLNPFDLSKSGSILDQILMENNLKNYSDPQLVRTLVKSKIAGNFIHKNSIGFCLKDMLLSCYFNDQECHDSDFVPFYDFDFVNCFTFNSGYDKYGNKVPIKVVNLQGTDLGLKLELYLGLDKANLTRFITNSGARIIVHNQSTIPVVDSEGIDAATGFQNNIAIKKYFEHKLPYPYSNCIKNVKSKDAYNSRLYRAMFNELNMTLYRQKICLKLCLQDFIIKKCNCSDGSLPNIYQNVTICQNLETIKCMIDARDKYFSSGSVACDECPLSCDSVFYSKYISYSRYPTHYYLDYIRNNSKILEKFNEYYNEGNFSKSTLIANIFYEDLDYSILEQVPAVSFGNLVSNIGGNLGFFIGVSVLSIFELVEYLIQGIFFIFSYFLKKKKKIFDLKSDQKIDL